MKNKISIKETKELLVALGLVAVAARKIGKDKKISIDDISALIDLSKDMDKLAEGVQGAGEIPSELGDLDESEVMEIIAGLYKISKDINKA
jgi:hypothetical protein